MTKTQVIVHIMNEYFDLKEEEKKFQRELERIWARKSELKQWLIDEGIAFDKNNNPTLRYEPPKLDKE